MKVLPEPFYNDKIEEARRLATFGGKDAPFIALQLKLRELGIVLCPIWTEDKDFLEESVKSMKFLALDTIAIKELLEERGLHEIVDDMKNEDYEKVRKENELNQRLHT